MDKLFSSFYFESCSFDTKSKKITLKYSLDKKLFFSEEFILNYDFTNYNKEALDKAIFGLFVMCGISYYKTYLPPNIEFERGYSLTLEEKTFFEKTWLNGLGEFFYKNKVDFRGLIGFPYNKNKIKNSVKIDNLDGNIVPIGGGKDSLVSATILKKEGVDYETFTVGNYPFLDSMIAKIGKKHNTITRVISPNLIKLNKNGYNNILPYNGHIPISSIWAFLGVITLILKNKKNLILSNESSANEENLILHGQKINHQYSKSLEFEKDLQKYIHTYISKDLNYFSLLRPLSELKIAEIFAEECFGEYKEDFTSCNKNFTLINKKESSNWCGKCPKCAFVSLIFAPFITRKEHIDLFKKDMFKDPGLDTIYQELAGISGHKPFECVGTEDEVNTAINLALQSSPDYPELEKFTKNKEFNDSNAYNSLQPNSMPKDFLEILKDQLSNYKN